MPDKRNLKNYLNILFYRIAQTFMWSWGTTKEEMIGSLKESTQRQDQSDLLCPKPYRILVLYQDKQRFFGDQEILQVNQKLNSRPYSYIKRNMSDRRNYLQFLGSNSAFSKMDF